MAAAGVSSQAAFATTAKAESVKSGFELLTQGFSTAGGHDRRLHNMFGVMIVWFARCNATSARFV